MEKELTQEVYKFTMRSLDCFALTTIFAIGCSGFTLKQPVELACNRGFSFTHSNTALFGSWGKRKKEFVDDEFARADGTRRGFEKYNLQERGDFLRRVDSERDRFMKKKDTEYLEIARLAGVSDQSGDGVEPMSEFDAGDEFNDDLDVSVQWEPSDSDENDDISSRSSPTYDPDSSITRLDNDLDVSGRTGQW